MAKRFGGKYSPKGAPQSPTQSDTSYVGSRVDPVGARANLMFLPAILLMITAIFEGAVGMLFGLVGAGALGLGAWLLRGGLQAEAAYLDRKVARRPALPRKILAGCLAGIGTVLAAVCHDSAVLAAALYGVAVGGLHLVAFGVDPLTDKGMEGVDAFQQDRVARVVDEADKHLSAMTETLRSVGDRNLTERMAQFQITVRKLIRTVEEDPRDLTAARKYLGIYLVGARDATTKFAEFYSKKQDGKAREDYLGLLNDLERNFAARQEKLLLEDHSDLAVEIEVLRERLDREGVHLGE